MKTVLTAVLGSMALATACEDQATQGDDNMQSLLCKEVDIGVPGAYPTHQEPQPRSVWNVVWFGAWAASSPTIMDMDGDNRPDILVGNQADNSHALLNMGGMRFSDVTEASGLGLFGVSSFSSGDLDRDGDDDVIAGFYLPSGEHPLRVYKNDGQGRFTLWQEPEMPMGLVLTVAVVDLDLDGDMDVLVSRPSWPNANMPGNAVLMNDGDGMLANKAEELGLADTGYTWSQGVVRLPSGPAIVVLNDPVADTSEEHGGGRDKDGGEHMCMGPPVPGGPCDHQPDNGEHGEGKDPDVSASMVYFPSRDGMYVPRRLEGVESPMGMAQCRHEEGEGCLFLADYEDDRLYFPTDEWPWTDTALQAGVRGDAEKERYDVQVSWGAVFTDIDLDGDEDLFVANGGVNGELGIDPEQLAEGLMKGPQYNALYLNNGDGAYTWASEQAGITASHHSRAVAAADLDADGIPEILAGGWGEPMVAYQCALAQKRHWIAVRAPRGALVEIEVDAGTPILRKWNDPTGSPYGESWAVVHAGLGRKDRVARVTVTTRDGTWTETGMIEADQLLTIP